MLVSFAIALACIKASPTGPASPAPAPAPSVSLAPGLSPVLGGRPLVPGAVPIAGAPPTPPLSGQTEAELIEGVTRAVKTFTLGADLTPLGRLDAREANMLAAHLEANPRFRVTRWEGATIAFWREQDSRLGRTVPWGGYHRGAEGGQEALWRAAIRLRPRSPGAEWTDSDLVDRFQSEDAVFKLHAFQPAGAAWKDWRAAALEVTGPAASMELHELSPGLALEPMSVVIKEMTRDLLSLDRFQGQAPHEGRHWGWLPPGEPTSDPQGLYLTVLEDGIDLRGRLNPGKAGWTWVRLTDGQGHPWLEELVGAATLERIGWSTQAGESFWFQGRVPTTVPLPPSPIVEAWFLADGTSSPVQVGRWSGG